MATAKTPNRSESMTEEQRANLQRQIILCDCEIEKWLVFGREFDSEPVQRELNRRDGIIEAISLFGGCTDEFWRVHWSEKKIAETKAAGSACIA